MIHNKLLSGTVIFFVLLCVVYLFFSVNPATILFVHILYLLPPAIGVLAGVYAIRAYNIKNPHAKSLLFITVGICLTFAGELTWFFYKHVLFINPFPSLADAFYIPSYWFFLLGFRNELQITSAHLKKSDPFTTFVMILFALLLTFVSVYFGVILAYDMSAPLLDNLVAISYGVGDTILVFPALQILKHALNYRGGRLFTAWISIFLAVIAMLIADILFAIFETPYTQDLWPFTNIDLFWIASFLLFAYGFFSIGVGIKAIQRQLTNSRKKV